MRSCGTRSTKDHGPTHTGAVANLSPSLLTAAGETGMPDRSARVATSGEKALFSRSRIVSGSTTSTAVTGSSSLRRLEPFISRCRSSENFTASAFMAVPSLNLTPLRSLMVTVLPASEIVGSAAASWGEMRRFSSIS